mgnify:CR=1 FL=1|tara:strand:- start:39 stop:488 length:450 start_codon:yes stop_codon:yes gene_type:complete
MNENHVLFVHIIGILVLTFGPLFARTDAHRILYLQVIVAVTLQWVLLGGRCSLSMVEHALRSEGQKGSDTGSGVWKHLSKSTGIRERTLIAINMIVYVINAVAMSATVGSPLARLLAGTAVFLTLVATYQWNARISQFNKSKNKDTRED